MGTNYYAHANPCAHCGQPEDGKVYHIGKSSGGWRFSLHHHVDWDVDLHSPDDWFEFINKVKAVVKDEYGGPVALDDLREIITGRQGTVTRQNASTGHDYTTACVDTKHGLMRHIRDGRHCTLSLDDATWDLIEGEFS